MTRIIILTSNELRHDFFRMYVAAESNINVLKSFCEVPVLNLKEKVLNQENHTLRNLHLEGREQTEIDFFQKFCEESLDSSNPKFIPKGSINSEEKIAAIINLNPDLIIVYGSSILQKRLIDKFSGKVINIHLGLSPYYRGSGTNFFPFVNNQMEYVGVTFMHIDEGIDTGTIIHQIRPTVCLGDTIHQINNRLIKEMTDVTIKLINNFDKLEVLAPILIDKKEEKYYKNSDFTEESIEVMNRNFSNEMIHNYILNREIVNAKVKILENPVLL